MADKLRDAISSVFSVLPESLARDARHETMRQFLARDENSRDDLKWVETDEYAKVVRAGTTDFAGFTRIYVNADDDSETAMLAAHLASGVHPGAVFSATDQQVLFWFVAAVPTHIGSASAKLKGLAISQRLFAAMCDRLAGQTKLTSSEKRVLFQLCMGIALRDAAECDGLAFETKRAQVKSACSKLHCHTQSDLVRIGMGWMSSLISLAGLHADAGHLVEEYSAEFLDPEVRLNLLRMPNGHVLRYYDLGPLDGRPVLVFHGMLIPVLLNGATKFLKAAGLRLIVPIRQGYLDGMSPNHLLQRDVLIARSLEDAEVLVRNHLPAPVAILGHSYGGAVAIRFAATHPELVKGIVILSINGGFQVRKDGFSLPLYAGLRAISNRPGLLRMISWKFKQIYADRKTSQGVLQQLFGQSMSDGAVIKEFSTSPHMSDWFSRLFRISVNGIAEDFRFAMEEWPAELSDLKMPVDFIHGTEDPITSAEALCEIASRCHGASVKLMQGGHLICASSREKVWSLIAGSVYG